MLKPGTYAATIAGIDFANGKDYTAGVLAHLSVEGTIRIQHVWQFPKGLKTKVHSRYDLMDLSSFCTSVERRKRNRHHKRKPQPNHGPQRRNQW